MVRPGGGQEEEDGDDEDEDGEEPPTFRSTISFVLGKLLGQTLWNCGLVQTSSPWELPPLFSMWS